MTALAGIDVDPDTGAVTANRTSLIRYGLGALVSFLVLVVIVSKALAPEAQTVPVPVVQATPDTTPVEVGPPQTVGRSDPLAYYGQLTPTAAALVGDSWEARRELAAEVADFTTQLGVDHCALFLGATQPGVWELSTSQTPGFPVPVFVGCAPPTTTTAPTTAPTTTEVKAP